MEKEKEVNRVLTLDECVKLIKKKYIFERNFEGR